MNINVFKKNIYIYQQYCFVEVYNVIFISIYSSTFLIEILLSLEWFES